MDRADLRCPNAAGAGLTGTGPIGTGMTGSRVTDAGLIFVTRAVRMFGYGFLAVVLALFRNRDTVYVDEVRVMKG